MRHINNQNQNDFRVSILVKKGKYGDYHAIVPDIPKSKNNGYMEVALIGRGETEEYAVEALKKNLTQWLYERIDDKKPVPVFSSVDVIKERVFSSPYYNDSYKVIELYLLEKDIFNTR